MCVVVVVVVYICYSSATYIMNGDINSEWIQG